VRALGAFGSRNALKGVLDVIHMVACRTLEGHWLWGNLASPRHSLFQIMAHIVLSLCGDDFFDLFNPVGVYYYNVVVLELRHVTGRFEKIGAFVVQLVSAHE
jgi:hypothetical protein